MSRRIVVAVVGALIFLLFLASMSVPARLAPVHQQQRLVPKPARSRNERQVGDPAVSKQQGAAGVGAEATAEAEAELLQRLRDASDRTRGDAAAVERRADPVKQPAAGLATRLHSKENPVAVKEIPVAVKEIPVVVVDEHMHVLPYWFQLGSKAAPLGATLVVREWLSS